MNAIEINNLSVAYRSYTQRPASMKEAALRFLKGQAVNPHQAFNALQDVSVTIPRGSVFGILGSNGSGKSTLLKIIAGVLKPAAGSTRVSGSVASLIELGAGFDPELNAIENIYLHGALHRKTRKEMSSKVDKILDFSELREFAHTPIKYYSSGMFARLGFSVAIDIDPDILLVDEILGVGDERFQTKCAGVFQNFIANGKTLILVSHDLNLMLDKAPNSLLLSKGRAVFCGETKLALEHYRSANYESRLS